MFRSGYLLPLLEPLKSIRGGIHFGGDLKLVNECCRSHISATTSIGDEFVYLMSNNAPGVEYLIPLARFKGNVFGMKGSSNTQ